MPNDNLRSYIANLPVGAMQARREPELESVVTAVDLDDLPDGIVTGSAWTPLPLPAIGR